MDRAQIVHQNFLDRVAAGQLPAGASPRSGLAPDTAVAVYRAQVLSRALDLTSRAMQKAGEGFYTIGSSGHEGMAAVARALRADDMAFLHYRDAAFQIARADQVPGQRIAWDMLLSFACSSEDPTSGGRHKVLGSKALMIPPQTSTIASHLPKAVGAAYSVGAARRHRPEHQLLADDSIVMCSFGDASANHSTAQGAINAAGWTSVQSIPLPLLFVCEDNGIGISTKTPTGWIEASMAGRPGIKYFKTDGLDLCEAYATALEAAEYVRTRRKPAFLHLRTVRLYGHAGADVPTTYLAKSEVEADEANDPLLHSVRLLAEAGALEPQEALKIYNDTCDRVERIRTEVVTRPHLKTGADVAASLIPPARICAPTNGVPPEKRAETFGSDMRAMDEPQPMSRLINWALTDLMLEHGEIVMMGEDVGRKGGVYGVTQKLHQRFGPDRMIDTLLDEQSILGLAIGMGHNGFLPMPEIQFLAYLHNAEDQIRGEAATLPFFSNGQFSNPMVLRIAGLGYQKGFGGHFHNDNSLAVLRDIPGIVIACPSDGAEAAMMMREAVRLAREEQRVVVFVEPIALYPMRDLHETKDGGWMRAYPAPDQRIALGDVGIDGDGTDLAIVTYGNGRYLSTQAKAELEAKGIKTRIIDLRWLAPLPAEALLEATKGCKHVLIVDECRTTGSQSEGLMALFTENGVTSLARHAAGDCFISTGPAYAATLPSKDSILAAALDLTGGAK
ncbi:MULTISPECIES: thiamine pyrophosphate-dependent enzyme [Rhodobacterales]|jgi:2-oxoisovalerate dehydrogenase E1 component|uniref:thiamine pyrophosphate-dependent enzyme n=1 Tax=Rhodobacterales TaxID=204455 RepID=UPI00237FD09E|nr:thiamine pyrophosphate-dependent enzyme [Phaeobacter gallaeciensis]MDE4141606.1 thiamine pyrophosphate-dependent enzyme [Phaeobacter gallaeciensis]MDE4150051.1 thiamine pyrophosphate-dependent enzyme [Phaeobacter gallaeciensis]MDE4154277.1 thiamine pyrophosphate-dependent enzyme [Phaeobacter gallaeciensis]MDE4229554.1 thiamine pyrophosphate-dependent enzyme [Phaeobacter gallaeciensis]MDE4258743.1 thiamine pyrophosphate-dependent enzyme [Phaeobacter gallaeciensis]